MAKRKPTGKHASSHRAESDATAPTTARSDRRPRRRRAVFALIGLMGAAIVLGPQLVAWTPLFGWLVGRAGGGRIGAITVEAASLAWWRPVQLGNLDIRDIKGAKLLRVAQVTSEHSLLALLCNPQKLGVWHIVGPELELGIRPDSSNLEDALRPFFEVPGGEPSGRSARVVVQNGKLRWSDDMHRQATAFPVQAEVELNPNGPHALKFRVSALITSSTNDLPRIIKQSAHPSSDMASSASMPQNFQCVGQLTSVPSVDPQLDLEVTLHDFPLDCLPPLARRAGRSADVSGIASGALKTTCHIGQRVSIETLMCELQTREIQLQSDLLRDDHLDWARFDLRLQLTQSAGRLQIDHGKVECDAGNIVVEGAIDVGRLQSASGSWMEWMRALPISSQGRIDLVAVARELPHTLNIRPDVQIMGGELRWDLQLDPNGDEPRWSGVVETSDLRAQRNHESWALTEPLRVQCQFRAQAEGLVADELVVASPFLNVRGQGNLKQGQLELYGDLEQANQYLARFFDLGKTRWTGRLDSRVTWQSTADGSWRCNGQVKGEKIECRSGKGKTWREPLMTARFQALGQVENWLCQQLTQADLKLAAGTDQLVVELRDAVDSPSANSVWPLSAEIHGNLASWEQRLAWFAATELPQLSGSLSSKHHIVVSPTAVRFEPSELTIRNLDAVVGKQRYHEPALQVELRGNLDRRTRTIDCQLLTVASTSAAMRAQDLCWPFDFRIASKPGQLHLRGDLAKLWEHLSPQAADRASGQFTGKLQIAPSEDGISIRSVCEIRQFKWQSYHDSAGQRLNGPRTVWSEPEVKLALDADWDRRAEALRLQRGQLQLDGAVVALKGQMSELNQSVKAELSGSTRIDFDRLSPRLTSLFGPSIRIQGQMDKPFMLRGPLRLDPGIQPSDTRIVSRDASMSSWKVSDALQATAGFGWQSAQAWGFELAPGSIDARLEGPLLTIVPVDLPISGGRLHLSPRIRLQHPMVMTLDSGVLVDRVAITPTMCHSWIKYIAPLVADATAAEGRFSVRLAHAEIPLQDSSRAKIEGSLAIHAGQIGPGPLAREFLTLAQQIRTMLDPQSGAARILDGGTSWITLPDQRISFRVAEGRVAHQDLQMQVGEVIIRTRGWVGMNQQLSMVAEVPIQDDWVAQRRWLAGLRGQTLQIPISGSLQRPQLDRRVLQNLSRDTYRGAAEGMIQQELQRQLEKLLPGR